MDLDHISENTDRIARDYIEAANRSVKVAMDNASKQRSSAKPSRFDKAFNWFTARLDHFSECSPDDFERKCDAITRTIITVTFSLCAITVITEAAILWLLGR